MSSIPQHGAHSFLIALFLGAPAVLAGVIGLLGMLPDLLALPETIKGNWSNLYRKSHTFRWWMVLVPPILLHLFIDWMTHSEEGGWTPLAWTLEIILDSLCILIIGLLWVTR